MKPELAPWCPMCGPMERCDEDGLCAACGAPLILAEVYEEIVAKERERITRAIEGLRESKH